MDLHRAEQPSDFRSEEEPNHDVLRPADIAEAVAQPVEDEVCKDVANPDYRERRQK